MINPYLFEPTYKKMYADNRIYGERYYRAFVGLMARRKFKRASEAETYAKRLHKRWCRLYDAEILAMVEPEK